MNTKEILLKGHKCGIETGGIENGKKNSTTPKENIREEFTQKFW